jgi:hypothetical protein
MRPVQRARRPNKRVAVLAAALLMAAIAAYEGCDNTFTPKSEFHPQLVVYCVLNPLTGPQIVVVEKSYDATVSLDPVPLTDKEVAEATIRITEGTRVYIPTDTLVAVGNSQRRVWVFRTLQPKQSTPYRIDVAVPALPAVSGELFVPSRIYLRGETAALDLDNPDSSALVLKSDLALETNPPHAYYYRLWVIGERTTGGSTTTERMEVPVRYGPGDARLYSQPTRNETQSFSFYAIRRTNDRLFGDDSTVRNKKLVMTGYAMEPHFYNYYKVVRGFDDPLSVRIDNPNVSYINGGLGVFGAFLADSTRFDYHFFIKE